MLALYISTMPLAVSAAVQVSDPTFYARYSFLRLLEADDTLMLSDEAFFDEAAKVVFPVNEYLLPEGNALLSELEHTIIPQINADSLQLVRMVFRGAASPVGPVEGNRLLGGFFRCKYDPYRYVNPIDPTYHDDLYYYKWTLDASLFKKRQYRWNWLGPTRIGITLTYDLLYRRIQKHGASFKSKEKIED